VGHHRSSPHPTPWRPQKRSKRRAGFSFPLVFPWSLSLALLSFCHFTCSGDRPGRRAKGCLQRAATARTADRNRTVHILAMISIGRTRVMNKQKKKKRRAVSQIASLAYQLPVASSPQRTPSTFAYPANGWPLTRRFGRSPSS